MNDMQKTPVSTDSRLNCTYRTALDLKRVLRKFGIHVIVTVSSDSAGKPEEYPNNYYLDSALDKAGNFNFYPIGADNSKLINVAMLYQRCYEMGKVGVEIGQIFFEVFKPEAVDVSNWYMSIADIRETVNAQIEDMTEF